MRKRMEINFYERIHNTLTHNNEGVLLIKRKADNEYETFTGGQILARIKAFRDAILQHNPKENDNVMVALYLEEGLIEAVLACMSLGLTAVIPPPGATARQFLSAIKQQHVHFLFTHDETSAIARMMVNLYGCKTLMPNEIIIKNEHLPEFEIDEVESFEIALISYHSSNNGDLRAVYRTHATMNAQHEALKKVYQTWAGQLDYPLVPNTVLHNLALGVCTLFPEVDKNRPHVYDAHNIASQIFDMKVQTMMGNANYYRQILKTLNGNKRIFPFLREIGVGGSPVPEKLFHELKNVFLISNPFIVYGCIEAEPIAIRRYDGKRYDPILGYNVGKPHPDIEVMIEKEWQIVLGHGLQDIGEVKIRGPYVSLPPGKEWYATGDFGYFDIEGNLILTARRGNERVFDGFQHYQIEHALLHHLDLESVAAVYRERGFKVYYIGHADEAAVWEKCEELFPKGLVISVSKKSKLPYDRRHQSKIMYHSLS